MCPEKHSVPRGRNLDHTLFPLITGLSAASPRHYVCQGLHSPEQPSYRSSVPFPHPLLRFLASQQITFKKWKGRGYRGKGPWEETAPNLSGKSKIMNGDVQLALLKLKWLMLPKTSAPKCVHTCENCFSRREKCPQVWIYTALHGQRSESKKNNIKNNNNN